MTDRTDQGDTLRPPAFLIRAPIFALAALSYAIASLFFLPGIGSILKWVWNGALTVGWGAVGLADTALGLAGVFPVKKLRICIVLPAGAEDAPADMDLLQDRLEAQVSQAAEVLLRAARVRLIPVAPILTPKRWKSRWVRGTARPDGSKIQEVGCNQRALREDLGLTGSRLERIAAGTVLEALPRRILGYGAPVVVFAVRSVRGFRGCSLGPLTDYVTLDRSSPTCLAHELAHACNLPHHQGDPENLMDPHTCAGTQLKRWQVLLLRMSRHVSYL